MAILKNTIIDDQGFITIPSGTTGNRPASPQDGMVRYNTTLGLVEEYRAGSWNQISHVALEGSEFVKGKVLQTIYSNTTSILSTTSTSFQNSNLTATITPQRSSSTIIVMVSQILRSTANTTSSRTAESRLRRTVDGATSTIGVHNFYHRARGSNSSERWTFTDSWSYRENATLSPITYFTQIRRVSNDTIQAQYQDTANSRSTITIIEVAN